MPIKNARELQQTREQIARLRRGVDAIRTQVEARNTKNLKILTEGPRNMIAKLEAEVDEYLARNKGDPDDKR